MKDMLMKENQSITGNGATRWAWVIMCALLLLALQVLAVRAQPAQSGIYEPADGEVLTGIVIVRGTAAHSSFLRYEVAFRRQSASDWIVFADSEQPLVDGTLAIWDTTVGQPGSPVFPDGTYQLRLRVVHQDYNYDEYFVRNLVVANASGTPTPTGTATSPGRQATVVPTASAESGLDIDRPTKLPTLTPFPTPLPPATPANVIVSAGEQNGPTVEGEETGGVFGRLASMNVSGLGRAFWRGASISGYLFLALALYLGARAIFRLLWRFFWTRIGSKR